MRVRSKTRPRAERAEREPAEQLQSLTPVQCSLPVSCAPRLIMVVR
jgi:hypothetical protein